MQNFSYFSLLAALCVFAICFMPVGHRGLGPEDHSTLALQPESAGLYNGKGSQSAENDGGKGPELEKWYFEQWHQPYGNVLDPEMMERIWADVRRVPSENDLGTLPVNSWTVVGPYGMVTPGGARYSGRILDIEVDNSASTRIAAASGGLWGFVFIAPVPLSDPVSSLAIGSFRTDPTDANKIFVGTGEPSQRGGTGMWKTTNGGTTWTQVPLSPTPGAFYRIRTTPGNPQKVHAVTTTGYYRSDNGGVNWTRWLSGDATDIAINPVNVNIMYTALWSLGVYKSTDGGNSWTRLTSGGIPSTNVGRTAISLCTSSPSTIYVSIAANDSSNTLGVYKTTNDASTWINVTPPENFLGFQGWYDNVIGVSPTNANIVLVGGVTLFRTTNGGTAWSRIDNENVHVDHHAITWNSGGTSVWNGNDGGMSFSNDQGVSWSTNGNILPITQYVNFDVGQNNTGVIFGGSQDNGYSGTTNGGTNWNHTLGGDGGGISIDPSDASRIFGTLGVY